jgi:FkbM family methyltransferase
MTAVKKILYKILGLKSYLKLISKTYICGINAGLWKNSYPELHHLKNIIRKGDICIDIGANMGYYSYFLSKYSGKTGKVYAVEPIKLFGEILKKNVNHKKKDNFIIYPYALGEKEQIVQMGVPVIDGVLHHGMTKVISEKNKDFEKVFDVEMRVPDDLFSGIEKIDFIKVDIEGYEHLVFSNMTNTIKRCSPIIQSELSGTENRKSVINLLTSIGYKTYVLDNKNFKEID